MPSYETRVNQKLLFDFFITFSRVEYALKNSDLFKRADSIEIKKFNEKGILQEAQPDWDRFAVLLREQFQANKTQALEQACEYILTSPPLKQIIINDGIAWETTPIRPASETKAEFLIRMIRRIRNNLFHGGMHNMEVHEHISRTELLLRSSLIILKECLALATHVKRAFDEAVI